MRPPKSNNSDVSGFIHAFLNLSGLTHSIVNVDVPILKPFPGGENKRALSAFLVLYE